MQKALYFLLLLAVGAASLMAQKPFAEKLHDPTTDRPYPLVRTSNLNYSTQNLALAGNFYRLCFPSAFVSFGITERGTTEAVILGSGEITLTPTDKVRLLEIVLAPDDSLGPPRPMDTLPQHAQVRAAYLRFHPSDAFLKIPADALRPEPSAELHRRVDALHRARFPLYLTHGAGLAVIPPPGLRLLDVELTSGERLLIFDLADVQQSITRLRRP